MVDASHGCLELEAMQVDGGVRLAVGIGAT